MNDYGYFKKFLFYEIHIEELTDELIWCLNFLHNNPAVVGKWVGVEMNQDWPGIDSCS